MASVVAVCTDGNFTQVNTLNGQVMRCNGTLTQADWPPPTLLPPLSISESVAILAAFAGLLALTWAFTKLRAVI
jgi:protein-S-isoprenylcysteine O-methyltransferase Ste14